MSSGPPSNGPPASAEPPSARPARRYRAVAHRAGNNLHDLERALAAGVDAIECDFWHDRGRLSLRHERKLPALPVLYDRWYLRFSLGELNLRDLLREIDGRVQLFLDIKSSTVKAADAVLDLYHDNEAMMPPTLVSSKQWDLLHRLARAGTGMRMLYSVGRRHQIEALLRRAREEYAPAGTSIRQTFLDADLIGRLHDEGLQVYAWTVNNRRRAVELLSWGVDGLISDDVEMFEALDRGER